jgi:hypothetical protein
MSDEIINEEDITTEDINIELTPEQLLGAPEEGVTAFLVIKRPNNAGWYATANLNVRPNIERPAAMEDIKHGCRDITDSMNNTDIAHMVLAMAKDLIVKQDNQTE